MWLGSHDMNEDEFEISYFESEHDRCYYKACDVRPVLPDVLAHVGGANYEIPKGWCGFGLKLKPAATVVKIFENWNVDIPRMQGFRPSLDPARGQPANVWRPQDLHIAQRAVQRVGHIYRPVAFESQYAGCAAVQAESEFNLDVWRDDRMDGEVRQGANIVTRRQQGN